MTLAEIIQAFVKGEFDKLQIYSEVATVTSVNETDRTCEAELVSGGKVYEIRLQSVIGNSNGFVQIPAVNSKILITFLNKSTGFVSLCSEVSKILIDTDLVQFNQGTLDGMVKINDLVSRINDLENLFTTLQTNIGSWIVAPNDGGLAFKTVLTTPPTGFATKTVPSTIKADFENTKITQ